jgi:hypothetical protein
VSGRTPQQAYLDLQKLARLQGRNTQQLFELYIHERFLARLAASAFAERFVLKGGMLLAVLDVRRATRDADMLVRGLASDEDSLRAVVGEILAIPMEDGVGFNPAGISITAIREEADYEGVRLTLPVDLAGAALKLKLDLSFGDPVTPQRVDYPTLLDDHTFQLLAYPMENVIAEKAETMMFLGDTHTRDRDYGDVYLLSEIHAIDAELLRRALREVAKHRRHELRPLGPQLETLRQARQQPWAAFRARVGLAGLPEYFSEVVDRAVEIVDGVHDESVSRWHPMERRWK